MCQGGGIGAGQHPRAGFRAPQGLREAWQESRSGIPERSLIGASRVVRWVCRLANGLLTAASGNVRNRTATSGGAPVGNAVKRWVLPLVAGGLHLVGGRSSPPSDTAERSGQSRCRGSWGCRLQTDLQTSGPGPRRHGACCTRPIFAFRRWLPPALGGDQRAQCCSLHRSRAPLVLAARAGGRSPSRVAWRSSVSVQRGSDP